MSTRSGRRGDRCVSPVRSKKKNKNKTASRKPLMWSGGGGTRFLWSFCVQDGGDLNPALAWRTPPPSMKTTVSRGNYRMCMQWEDIDEYLLSISRIKDGVRVQEHLKVFSKYVTLSIVNRTVTPHHARWTLYFPMLRQLQDGQESY